MLARIYSVFHSSVLINEYQRYWNEVEDLLAGTGAMIGIVAPTSTLLEVANESGAFCVSLSTGDHILPYNKTSS